MPAVTRYFDHIQSAPAVRSSATLFDDSYKIISFDLQHAPKSERNPDSGKKRDKALKTTAAKQDGVVAETSSSADKQSPKEKGKKKEKAEQATAASNAVATKKQGKAPAEDDGEPVPSMIDLRVGHIVDGKVASLFIKLVANLFVPVKKHPDADSLYVEVSTCCSAYTFSLSSLAN